MANSHSSTLIVLCDLQHYVNSMCTFHSLLLCNTITIVFEFRRYIFVFLILSYLVFLAILSTFIYTTSICYLLFNVYGLISALYISIDLYWALFLSIALITSNDVIETSCNSFCYFTMLRHIFM